MNKLTAKSRITEVAAVGMQLIDVYKNGDWSIDPHLVSIYDVLEQQAAELTKAIKRTKAELDLEATDELRDNKTRSVYFLTQGLLHYPETKIKAAAQALNLVFNKYDLDRLGICSAEQTSPCIALMRDLETPSLLYHIKALPGMPELVNELSKAHEDFIVAHTAYQTEIASADVVRSNAFQLKGKVLDTINKKIVVYLRAMIQVNESRYAGLAGTIAQFIAANNKNVDKRSNGLG